MIIPKGPALVQKGMASKIHLPGNTYLIGTENPSWYYLRASPWLKRI